MLSNEVLSSSSSSTRRNPACSRGRHPSASCALKGGEQAKCFRILLADKCSSSTRSQASSWREAAMFAGVCQKCLINRQSPADFWPVALPECLNPATVWNQSKTHGMTWGNYLLAPVSEPVHQVEQQCAHFLHEDWLPIKPALLTQPCSGARCPQPLQITFLKTIASSLDDTKEEE